MNGLFPIKNKKQLVSYAGFDVREKQSGTSINGKARISKRGNKYIRKAMYFPSWAAISNDERFQMIYSRHVEKHGIKMKAGVVIQRKLLEMIYTVYKTGKAYDKEYWKKQEVDSLINI